MSHHYILNLNLNYCFACFDQLLIYFSPTCTNHHDLTFSIRVY